MNQILFFNSKSNDTKVINKNGKKNNMFAFFVTIFIICIFILLFFVYLCFKHFKITKNNVEFAESLSNTVRIQSLYNDSISNNSVFPIVGQIEIKKINLNYPIFSTTNDDLLKLGICKFYGPPINSKGNLCLAGHNYDNNIFFSNLYKLQLDDIITIYDSSNISVDYKIYSIFEVSSSNTSILDQNTNFREITLITCNNINKNRIIVKAKEIE